MLGGTGWLFAVALAIPVALAGPAVQSDPFGLFEPAIVVTAGERRQLARDEPIVRLLPSTGTDVGTFAAIRTRVDGDRLVAWMRAIEQLKRGQYVRVVKRFSEPPVLSDLDGFSLESDELNDLRRCRPGNCGLKLSAAEMVQLSSAIKMAGDAGEDWKLAAQRTFRTAMLARVRAYLAGGYAALAPHEDHEGILAAPLVRATSLINRVGFLSAAWPEFAELMTRYPRISLPGTESFVYWSSESPRGRPIMSATHVTIGRGGGVGSPEVVVAGMQLFATHYTDASIGVTLLLKGSEGWNYLVYVNHSDVDVLGGRLGGLVRMGFQQRLPSEARELLRQLRRRLETEPPL